MTAMRTLSLPWIARRTCTHAQNADAHALLRGRVHAACLPACLPACLRLQLENFVKYGLLVGSYSWHTDDDDDNSLRLAALVAFVASTLANVLLALLAETLCASTVTRPATTATGTCSNWLSRLGTALHVANSLSPLATPLFIGGKFGCGGLQSAGMVILGTILFMKLVSYVSIAFPFFLAPSPSLCLSLSLSLSLSLLSLSLSLILSLSFSLSHSLTLSLSLSVSLCVSLAFSLCRPLPLFVSLSISLCLSLCLSRFLSLSLIPKAEAISSD
jgi:hypothetical protein